MDWEAIKKALVQMGTPYLEQPVEPQLAEYIRYFGYDPKPMIVNLKNQEMVNADIGVIVTNKDESVNNGVYIFCTLKDHTMGLITVIPSTVTKGPMIRKVCGNITDAVTGLDLPPLTPFDMIEITGQVIANTVIKNLISAFNIPKEKEHAFTCMYLPKFLANVAMYYTGAADKDGNPMVYEETADMEPAQIRAMVMGNDLPDIFKTRERETNEKVEKESDTAGNETSG